MWWAPAACAGSSSSQLMIGELSNDQRSYAGFALPSSSCQTLSSFLKMSDSIADVRAGWSRRGGRIRLVLRPTEAGCR